MGKLTSPKASGLMPAEKMLPDFRPKLLDYVEWKTKRNLFRRIGEGVFRRIANSGQPGGCHCRGRVESREVGKVESGVTLVVIGKETVDNSVQGAARDAALAGRNVADILVQDGRQGA